MLFFLSFPHPAFTIKNAGEATLQWGSEALVWLFRKNEKKETSPPVSWHVAMLKDMYADLSQGVNEAQACATTRSEQTMMVPIGAPP
jgi:hypothetical protein